MAQVGIIGGGAFGTAMACVIRRSGHDCLLWAREPEVVAGINREGVNPLFLSGVGLVPGITATNDIAPATRERDFILMAVPAQHVRGVAANMRPFLAAGTPVVTCSKGIERGTCALMPEVLAETLPGATVAVLSGPSFAREIAVDLPCAVTLACAGDDVRARLARDIANPRFCIHPSDDVIGAAIGGVMKNVISIGSGIAAGRKLGENARATLITLGLAEAMRLGLAKGAKPDTFMGLSGIGDLMLTANSLQSRNTSLGVALGEGRKLAEVLAGRKEVTEGAFSTEAVAALARRLGVEMPITFALDQVLNHGAEIEPGIARLIARLGGLVRAG
ncbi:MAG TPA: NAD(P)H-dependent glycerol-3-phosphate dehydrogenase [Burkholderiales bacterium]|nr:NAD(P)H-dependent glycerol-3-phosphate dehydrogenase [Burkholderiales bacterium]